MSSLSMAATLTSYTLFWKSPAYTRIQCCSDSDPKRGFGPQQDRKDADKVSDGGSLSRPRKSNSQQSGATPNRAPWLSSRSHGIQNNVSQDVQFEERLKAIKRSTLDQKKAEQIEEFGKIEYDVPVKSARTKTELGTKIGLGFALVVFGFVFALGDFIPTQSSSEDGVDVKMSEDDKANLQARMQNFEETLKISPKDSTALEGEAVILAELGEYTQAASLLEDIIKNEPSSDAFRLLGEVKFNLKDYEGSAAAYKSSATMAESVNFEVLRGLTNALLAAKRPDEAVQFLLVLRERLHSEKSQGATTKVDDSATGELVEVDPIQVELLLGKAYADWGHVSDAVSVYDHLISSYPDDFRGYLAKGIILKESGNVGAAERMFIQARFFAPQNAKVLVDRYSRQ
ncbi:Tetratricopeptide repeat-containing domain [Heracleum sosnowskyi]|uniref:Tetratricopeptide repeat-containing domain n=1 Tax=Heracleum sosnowskyi TaxID=360622 RepID=A0AAD8M2R8_9APIA|nr:Tetratricopeptide repeat-containing domain [Heracleum sosnowskyi]